MNDLALRAEVRPPAEPRLAIIGLALSVHVFVEFEQEKP